MNSIVASQNNSATVRLGRFQRGVRIACATAIWGAFALAPQLHAQTTGFQQTGAGPWDYNTAGNWVSGINGIWNNDLTLAAAQNVTFAADTTLTTGLTFNYGGNFALNLYSTNTAARTLTLGGDVSLNTGGGTAAYVNIGNSFSNLIVNLGGVTRNIAVATNRTLTIYNAIINGGLVKSDIGTLVIRGGSGSTFAGGITVSNGALEGRNLSLGSTATNAVVYSDGTSVTGGQLILGANGASCSNGVPIVIRGVGESGANVRAALHGQQGWVTNSGAITLDGSGTYRIQCSPGNIVNANFNIKGGIARSGANVGTLVFEADSVNTGATNNQFLINSTINNNGGPVTLTSTTTGWATGNKAYGTLVLNTTGHSIGDFTINGTYVEPVTNATILKLGVSDPLNTSANLNLTKGELDLAGFNQTVNGLSGVVSVSLITNSSATPSTLTIGNGDGGNTYAGAIQDNASGTIALTKTGAGTETLSGANAYTGGTAINGGILSLGSSGALGASGTISFGGGTLQFSSANTTDYSPRFSTAISQAYSLDTGSQTVSLGTSLTSSGGSLTKLGAGTLNLMPQIPTAGAPPSTPAH